MEENNNLYSWGSANTSWDQIITDANAYVDTPVTNPLLEYVDIGEDLVERVNFEHKPQVELSSDKTSLDLARLTSEVIIKFLQSPEGINLLASELEKYFKK